MKDSGRRQQFGSGGAQRDTDAGKPDFSLLGPYDWPFVHAVYGVFVRDYLITQDIKHMDDMFGALVADFGMERFLEWLRQGAEKYDRFNWARGMPITRCLASLGRHLWARTQGSVDEDHAAAAMCNVSFIRHYHKAALAGLLRRDVIDLFEFNREKRA